MMDNFSSIGNEYYQLALPEKDLNESCFTQNRKDRNFCFFGMWPGGFFQFYKYALFNCLELKKHYNEDNYKKKYCNSLPNIFTLRVC